MEARGKSAKIVKESKKKTFREDESPQVKRVPRQTELDDETGGAEPKPPRADAASLDFSSRKLTDLSTLPEIPEDDMRTKLFLNDNKLIRLEGVERAPGVRQLYAMSNRIGPHGLLDIGPLHNLVVLNLTDNRIREIPKGALKHQTQLKVRLCQPLVLAASRFAELNRAMYTATQALILTKNKLTSLDHLFKHMSGVTTLTLSHNRLVSLPKMPTLSALLKLSLSGNLFSVFPDLSSCPNLSELRLNDNLITVVPKSIIVNCACLCSSGRACNTSCGYLLMLM